MSRLVSPVQRKALEALEAGAVIHVLRHNGPSLRDSAFITNPGDCRYRRPRKQTQHPSLSSGHETISTATVEALHVQGWLIDTEDPGYRWRGSRYIISDKGREQLEKEREEERTKAKIASLKRAGSNGDKS